MTTTLQSAPPIAAPTTGSDGAHFYELVSGKWQALHEEGGTFSMSDAKELRASGRIVVPSATGYLGMLRKPQLETWGKQETAKAARAIPVAEYAQEDEWVDAVVARANNASRGAMDLGSRIHKAVENYLCGREYDAAYQVYVEAIAKELTEYAMGGAASEQVVGSAKLGAAGTADMTHEAEMIIGDIKTRKHKVNKIKPSKVPAYETDWVQVAFYGYCVWGNQFFMAGRAIIFATSTVKPGLVTPHVRQGKELVAAMEAFIGLTAAYRYINNWDPRA